MNCGDGATRASLPTVINQTFLFDCRERRPRRSCKSPCDLLKLTTLPQGGNVIPSAQIPDETFAAGVLGEGVGIEPELGIVYAPFDGEISSTTDTKHAIGISSPDGMELLIHVGVNTVAMNGDGFELLCAEGDQVKAGQILMKFDIGKIKEAGYSTTTAVLVTNSDDYAGLDIVEGACDPLKCIVTCAE